MKPATIRHLHSSGGVIYRKQDAAFEVVLISTKKNSIWTLPKGLIDRGEPPEMTAIREIVEETGLVGKIVGELGEKSYWFYLKNENAKCRKKVTYFLVEYVSGNVEDHGWEVDDARWFEIEAAMQMLSYKSDKDILEKAKDKLVTKHDG
jgi:8-oxo-dGTP diphosphatase